MENKKGLKGINLLISVNILMMLIVAAMAISETVIAGIDISETPATVTGDSYGNNPTLWTMVVVGTFGGFFGIIIAIIQLVGVTKAGKMEKLFKRGIIPAVAFLIASVFIFIFGAAEVEPTNPVASGIAKIVLYVSFTLLTVFIFKAVEKLSTDLGDEKRAATCRSSFPLAIAFCVIAIICSALVSFLGKEILKVIGVRLLLYLKGTFVIFANIRLLGILFPAAGNIRKQMDE